MNILVTGDIILDTVISGEIKSNYSSFPTIHITSQQNYLGGAANVANNLNSLEAQVALSGTIGLDEAASKFLELLNSTKIKKENFFKTYEKPTTHKTRVCDKEKTIIRFDIEDISKNNIHLYPFSSNFDAVVLSDYNKGFITETLIKRIKHIPIIIANPKPANIELYKDINATVIVLNKSELIDSYRQIFDEEIHNWYKIKDLAKNLRNYLKCKHLLITLSELGMTLYPENIHLNAISKNVNDVCGCGDVTTATLAYGLCKGLIIEESMKLANKAAAISIEKFGTSVVTLEELEKYDCN